MFTLKHLLARKVLSFGAFLGLNRIKLVFSKFRDNLFALIEPMGICQIINIDQ